MPLNALPFSIRELACRPPSLHVDARSLGIATAEVFDIPPGAKYVYFKKTTDFYAKAGGAATIPGDITDGSASELNPTELMIEGFATIGVISPAASVVTASYYS